jgi:hypothetical protein
MAVQATVRSFDPQTRAGAVLLDDGLELAYAGGALDQRVRLLRLGQRVRVELDAQGTAVRRLSLATFSPAP